MNGIIRKVSKKTYAAMISLIIVGGLLGYAFLQGGDDAETETADEIIHKELYIYQYKPEVANEVEKLAKAYELEHPEIKVTIQTNAGRDYMAMLGTVFASGKQPDIFNVGGHEEMAMWQDYLEDLSQEPWIEHVKEGTLEPITTEEGIFGLPYNIEGYGILYNEDIFETAGIDTLPTNLEELEAVCIKLQSQGYTPFFNSHSEWWTMSIHSFNTLLAVHDDPVGYINDISEGRRSFGDDEYMDNWLAYMDLMTDYGQEKPFISGYGAQVEAFATGEAAMIQQGNWIDQLVYRLNPDIRIGMIPIPIESDFNDRIQVGIPSYWCVNSQSEMKEEAKDFLQWLVASEAGSKFIQEQVNFIPSYTTVADYDYMEISEEVNTYYKEGKTYTWEWTRMPIGYTNKLQEHIILYLKKEITRDELVERMDADLR